MTWLLAAGEGGQNPILPAPAEFIVALIFFGILVALVAKFVVPTFEKTYAERTAAIEGGIHHAEKAQAEANAALEKYNAQLADARGEANRIREQAREQAAAIVAEARDTAQQEAARIVANAQSHIEAERAAAESSLRQQVGTLATSLASRIVGEALEDDERSGRVVDRFLAELEASTDHDGQPAGAGSAATPAGS
jgi:F-type H+-transporting ATPase subunit b